MQASCDRFDNCLFVQEYIKDEKSPWYIKFCNGQYKKCKRHIYCCNKFNTGGKSLPVNFSPTGSIL